MKNSMIVFKIRRRFQRGEILSGFGQEKKLWVILEGWCVKI